MSKPRLGLLPPQAYMKSELDKLFKEYDVQIIDIKENDWDQESIDRCVKFCKDNNLPCVVGFAQKDAWHHALINAGLGNVTIKPTAYLIAMNKYMQRTIEEKAFWFTAIDPEKYTNQELIAKIPKSEWPFMLKNTSLSLGRGVFRIKSPQDMEEILDYYRSSTTLRAEIKATNDAIISRMSQAEKDALTEVPPFIAEHMVDMTRGWVEYCYEGCVNEEGVNTHYGMSEEVYFDDHQSLAYITPPCSYPDKYIPNLENYINGYMKGLVARGYLKQFYNIEFWATLNTEDGTPEFAFCEINPRCAHTFHYGYKFAYDTNLYRDNWELVLNNKAPVETPWKKWCAGSNKVCCEILITATVAAKVSDILDYEYVDMIESQNQVELIRHIKHRDYTLTDDDAKSGAGCTLLQIWIVTDTHKEAALREVEIRKKIYKMKFDWKYPQIWKDLVGSQL